MEGNAGLPPSEGVAPVATYRAALAFRPEGPVGTGDWPDVETARRICQQWVQLYARPDNTVTVQLQLVEHGDVQVLTSWPEGEENAAGGALPRA